MAGKGRIMAGLDDFGAELFIIGYIELIAIVQKSVFFLLLSKTISEPTRAFALKKSNGLADVRLAFSAMTYFIEKFGVFVKCGSGGDAEVLRFQYYLFAVIISIGDFVNREA